MTGSYETNETHLLLNGPGLFKLGAPWNETIEVEEGKTRQRKLPEDGVFDAEIIEGNQGDELAPVTRRRATKIGLARRVVITPDEDGS